MDDGCTFLIRSSIFLPGRLQGTPGFIASNCCDCRSKVAKIWMSSVCTPLQYMLNGQSLSAKIVAMLWERVHQDDSNLYPQWIDGCFSTAISRNNLPLKIFYEEFFHEFSLTTMQFHQFYLNIIGKGEAFHGLLFILIWRVVIALSRLFDCGCFLDCRCIYETSRQHLSAVEWWCENNSRVSSAPVQELYNIPPCITRSSDDSSCCREWDVLMEWNDLHLVCNNSQDIRSFVQ